MKKILAPIFLAATALVSQGAAVHTGLLSYWDFEGDYNDKAGSIAGNANTVDDNGTAGSAVTNTGGGPLGSYGGFNRTGAAGTDNVVTVPKSADTIAAGESLTVSAWFRVDAFDGGNWQGLIAHGESTDWRVARQNGSSTLGYAGGTADIGGGAGGPDVLTGSLWHHVVAITESGVSTRLWIDGALISTSGGAPTLSNDTRATDLLIGGNQQPGGDLRAWNGGIDDVALWNRPLTAAEIGEVYNAGLAGTSLGAIGVPEPSTGLLGFLGLALLARRRR